MQHTVHLSSAITSRSAHTRWDVHGGGYCDDHLSQVRCVRKLGMQQRACSTRGKLHWVGGHHQDSYVGGGHARQGVSEEEARTRDVQHRP